MSTPTPFKNPFKTFQNFRNREAFTGKTRTVLIVLMLVGVLVLGIVSAVIGSKLAEDKEGQQCACPSKVETGWKWFSITIIALGIPALVVGFIFFGCSVDVIRDAWGEGVPSL